jgi:hypothetical protein
VDLPSRLQATLDADNAGLKLTRADRLNGSRCHGDDFIGVEAAAGVQPCKCSKLWCSVQPPHRTPAFRAIAKAELQPGTQPGPRIFHSDETRLQFREAPVERTLLIEDGGGM